ncbi:MAG TPA: SLC13 family permease [Vicinamibacterales bacterium]|nr:SLC13 family permease [Vicinamibacterales bacterium]
MPPLLLLAISMALVIGLIVRLRLHAFVALLAGAAFVGLFAPSVALADMPTTVATEFGVICGRIGIIIALAAVIGLALQQSGAARRISEAFLRMTGRRNSDLSMWASGYVLSVPVFFDTVFYLLAPIARSLARLQAAAAGRPAVVSSEAGVAEGAATGDPPAHADFATTSRHMMAVMAGGAATHVFVPPTPGPLAAASALDVDLGLVVVVGLVVALPASLAGVVYARWIARRATTERFETLSTAASGIEAIEPPGLRPLGLTLSLSPIVLPVILISGRTVSGALEATGPIASAFTLLGDPNVALFISATIAVWLLRRATGWDVRALGELTETALASAGTIILITAAGGAYGAMLAKADIGSTLVEIGSSTHMPILWLGFFVAALLKIAQGSSTVAIITTASLLHAAYQADTAGVLPHPVYAVMAIGGGALVVSWMNDSGFWIVGRLGGFTERQTLRYWTATAATVGIVGFGVTLALSWIVPLRF